MIKNQLNGQLPNYLFFLIWFLAIYYCLCKELERIIKYYQKKMKKYNGNLFKYQFNKN